MVPPPDAPSGGSGFESPLPKLRLAAVSPADQPVAEAPAPAPVQEPVAAPPAPAPLVLEPAPAPVAPEPAEPMPSVQPIVWEEPTEEPAAPQPALEVGLQVSVYVRLEGGERIEVATIADAEEARTKAQELVTDIRRSEGWPFIAGRYIRPESIVSVDLDASIR